VWVIPIVCRERGILERGKSILTDCYYVDYADGARNFRPVDALLQGCSKIEGQKKGKPIPACVTDGRIMPVS
jgi:hypothetical protein